MEKELWHFTWPVRILISGILQIRKKCQHPDDLSILALFSDLQNSNPKYPKIISKVFKFFQAVAVRRICVRAPRWQKRRHFSWPVRVLKSGICKSKKSAIILGISGFWNFFRICEIPLLSPLTGHVKGRSFFRPIPSCAVWVPRHQKWRRFSLTLEVLTSGIFQIWKKSQNPEYLRILALFSDCQNSTFTYL
jgi:hypothetical protein